MGLDRSCSRGSGAACSQRGPRPVWGRGGARDPGPAAALSGRGCVRGHAGCCRAVFDLLKQGCAAGVAPACTDLGMRYINGVGTPRDSDRGAALLRKACESGYRRACQLLKRLDEAPSTKEV